MKYQQRLVLITFLVTIVSIVNATLPDTQVAALNAIDAAMGVPWKPSPPTCGSTFKNSVVVCDSTETTVVALSIDPVFTSTTIPNILDQFPSLKSLSLYNGIHNLYNLTTIRNHPTISTLQSFAGSINVTTDLTTMLSLDTLHIINGFNSVPLVRPGSLTYFHFVRAASQSLAGRIQQSVFSPKLTYFHLQSTTAQPWLEPSNSYLNFTIFADCPNLAYLIPAALKSLSLYGLATPNNHTFPSIQEVDWMNLSMLRLNNIQLSGTLPTQLFTSPTLNTLHVSGNANLNGILTTDIGYNKLTYFAAETTNLTGTVPTNIIDGGLSTLMLRNTKLSGALPGPFLCCAVQNLKPDNVKPTYLFDNAVFTNYFGPDAPRSCQPVITSIEPFPISSNSKITINGNDLGDVYLIQLINSIGDIASVGCLNSESNYYKLICTNPNIQGIGNITYRVINDQIPYPTTTVEFAYANPNITSVTRGSTLGGLITITGKDLFGDLPKDMEGTWVKIYGSNCTQIRVLEPFESFECVHEAGVTSNVTISLENKGLLSNDTLSPKFFFRNPLIISATAVLPDQETIITIAGMDLWNDTSIVSVLIDDGSIPCTVKTVNHSYVTCLVASMPYSEGTKTIQVSVNDQLSEKIPLFSFVDQVVCPDNCGNSDSSSSSSICSNGLGFCQCPINTFGPGCSSKQSTIQPVFSNSSAMIQLETFSFFLQSVIENGAETFIPKDQWVVDTTRGASSSSYFWSLGGKSVLVEIAMSTEPTSAVVGHSQFQVAANTYTYGVTYTSAIPVTSLAFTVMLETSPEECDTIPVQYATTSDSQGSTVNAHWMTFTKDDSQFYARFPLVAQIDNEQGYLVNEPLVDDTKSSILKVNIQSDQLITTTFFQFDATLLEAPESRSYDTQGSCPVKSDKWKAIVGGVVGGVAGAALAAAGAFIIFRQQRKINDTKSLLDKKLKELNHDL
ncbi:hypothetical protein DFA_09191 [Cavenderia fasciculata]|uniref:IPT/TIG domain-containing protein n=1 Tax=Cavenderia fasciculata TaxID=261658 RepID=F4Q6Y2_CACFS|nr:uncharacterized protein DFA_09191 [Cavenderia fasciculata]EGG16164.1 hypothetical protein DFA_09191 [Cavenderia fasciculata]|eukprot:XP_004352617.1 hypothetical protein DFA_09191 [Cavenderia fasciculata]